VWSKEDTMSFLSFSFDMVCAPILSDDAVYVVDKSKQVYKREWSASHWSLIYPKTEKVANIDEFLEKISE